MRRDRIVSSELFLNRVERLLRLALPRDDAECPVRNFLTARKPFVCPSEKNRSGETAFHHAVDVPAKHFGLLLLRMPERVHAEFTEDKRVFAGEILQPQQIPFEIALVVKVNVETGKIVVLREQIICLRIRGIRKERVWIDPSSDTNKLLDKFDHSTRAEPTHHRTEDFVTNQI